MKSSKTLKYKVSYLTNTWYIKSLIVMDTQAVQVTTLLYVGIYSHNVQDAEFVSELCKVSYNL